MKSVFSVQKCYKNCATTPAFEKKKYSFPVTCKSFAAFFLHLTCQVRGRDQPERCLCETSPSHCTLFVDCFSVYSLVNRHLINLFPYREIVAAMHVSLALNIKYSTCFNSSLFPIFVPLSAGMLHAARKCSIQANKCVLPVHTIYKANEMISIFSVF